MVLDTTVLQSRLNRLDRCVRRLEQIKATGKEAFLSSEDLQDVAERNLEIAIQCCLDIGSHIIASLGLRSPESYVGVLRELGHGGAFPADFARRIEGMAGMRNILVHDYLEVDPERIYEVLERVGDFKLFAVYVHDLMLRESER